MLSYRLYGKATLELINGVFFVINMISSGLFGCTWIFHGIPDESEKNKEAKKATNGSASTRIGNIKATRMAWIYWIHLWRTDSWKKNKKVTKKHDQKKLILWMVATHDTMIYLSHCMTEMSDKNLLLLVHKQKYTDSSKSTKLLINQKCNANHQICMSFNSHCRIVSDLKLFHIEFNKSKPCYFMQ